MLTVLIFFLLLIIPCPSLVAVIFPAPDLMQFVIELQRLDDKDLVLFDVDETLIIPMDAILQPSSQEVSENLSRKIFNNPANSLKNRYPDDYLQSLVLRQMRFQLVDPWIISLIDNLQIRRVNVIGFTSAKTGAFGEITSLEDWKIDKLREVGIVFELCLSDECCARLTRMQVEGHCPVYKNGILFTDQITKGPILCAFLNSIKWVPKTLFMIDNRLEALQSVEEALQKSGIRFVGFHYTAVADHPIPIDVKLAEYQFCYLTEHAIWLGDLAAKRKMERYSANRGFFSFFENFPVLRRSNLKTEK